MAGRLFAVVSGIAVGVFFGALIGIVLENWIAGMWIGVLFGVIMGMSVLRLTARRNRK